MIAQLTGKVVRKGAQNLVLDVNGVGYLITCVEATLARLPVGASATLRVHTAVREDAIELFGFATELEELLFHELVRVPGVGPRIAMGILSGGAPEEIAAAIVQGDLARLRKLPGVGKKTAERLVVDLRERLRGVANTPELPAASAPRQELEGMDDLLQALAALGYKPSEAERLASKARATAGEGAALEALVREALRAR